MTKSKSKSKARGNNKVKDVLRLRPVIKLKRKAPGQAPGTIEHTGVQRMESVQLTVHDYSDQHCDQIAIRSIEKSAPYLGDRSKTWIQVQGLHDVAQLKDIWSYFELHPLMQEDIVSVSQRPKIESYPEHLFIVLRMIAAPTQAGEDFRSEQVSLVLGPNYLLSFQESEDPVFAPIIKRLQVPGTRLRTLGTDYLAYALIDNVVDHYFLALDALNDKVERLEEEIMTQKQDDLLSDIHGLRRDLLYFRKSVWSLRDSMAQLLRDESTHISSEVKVFLRDVHDHVAQVIDNIENLRETVFSLYDMHMSTLSNRMNEVMKVLTIIATIFIPLTFIAGIYGMNFNPEAGRWNMPELNWPYGYPLAMGLMLIMALLMLLYFKRKKWL